MDKYSPTEFIANCVYYIRTKLFYTQYRFIRFPFYIRGKKSIAGAKGLTLGRFCRFELDGRKQTLTIGDRCEMGDMTHIVALNKIEIGNDVLIASKCFISDTSHGCYNGDEQDSPESAPNSRPLIHSTVKIGNNVWIGENAVILPGAEIGDGCIIGANAVVTHRIPSKCIVVGTGKIIKEWNSKTKKWDRINEEE